MGLAAALITMPPMPIEEKQRLYAATVARVGDWVLTLLPPVEVQWWEQQPYGVKGRPGYLKLAFSYFISR